MIENSKLCHLDLKLLQAVLLDKSISGWRIEKETEKFGGREGVISRSSVSSVRNKDKKFSFSSIGVLKLLALQKWLNTNEWKELVNLDKYKDIV